MWFKVDDKFHVNRKVRKLLRLNPAKRRDCAPGGLWLFAGTWCMNTEAADGFVPADELDQFDDDWERLADALCEASLWEVAEHKGEKGYQFHDWDVWQPIFELKKKRAEAGRKGGLASGKARSEKQAEALGSDDPEASAEANTNQTEAPAKHTEPIGEAKRTSSHPSPSQPIPEKNVAEVGQSSTGSKGARKDFDDDFERIETLTRGPRKHAEAVTAEILGRATGPVSSPMAFVISSIEREPERYRYQARAPKKSEQCPTHPHKPAKNCPGCAADRKAGDAAESKETE